MEKTENGYRLEIFDTKAEISFPFIEATDLHPRIEISRAEKELLTTDRPVGEIAAAVGFNSVAYFISCFREKNKVSPTAYRRAARA